MLVVQLTGCFTIRSWFDERKYARKIDHRAKEVWQHSEGAYRFVEHNLEDFGRGFVAGYKNVASGGDGCPPVMPPPYYWKAEFSNPLGKKKIVAWFDGFHHGAAAALGDNVADGRRILTSNEIYHKCRQYVEYIPEDAFDEEMQIQWGEPDSGFELAPLPEPAQLVPGLNPPPVPAETPKYVPEGGSNL
ncbi:MAG: hypothetical protein KDA78_06935 [Planctomycetaceae bacterium]|nr:hypothetical protein [Planctomycetaceae bacterium]